MNPSRRARFILTVFATALSFAGAASFAQMGPGGAPGQPMPNQQPQPGQQPNPTAGMNGVPDGNTASPLDQSFVQSVLESDAAEVQLGQLAQQKSQSDDVKKFGERMVENRTRLDQQLKPIADKLSVRKPKEPTKKDRQLIARLEALSGPQFDEEYIKAVVKDHQRDVKDFNTEAESAQDPALQQTAKQDANVLAQHLQAIEQIAQTHNVTVDDKK
jgi:putative membrane protein